MCVCNNSDGSCDPVTGSCFCEPGLTGKHCEWSKLPLRQHKTFAKPSRGNCVFPDNSLQAVLPPVCPARHRALRFHLGLIVSLILIPEKLFSDSFWAQQLFLMLRPHVGDRSVAYLASAIKVSILVLFIWFEVCTISL